MSTTSETAIPPQPADFNLDQIKDRLKQVLDTNGLKPSSAKARTIEYGYLHALQLVYGPNVYFTVCLTVGRSILD